MAPFVWLGLALAWVEEQCLPIVEWLFFPGED